MVRNGSGWRVVRSCEVCGTAIWSSQFVREDEARRYAREVMQHANGFRCLLHGKKKVAHAETKAEGA